MISYNGFIVISYNGFIDISYNGFYESSDYSYFLSWFTMIIYHKHIVTASHGFRKIACHDRVHSAGLSWIIIIVYL